MKGVILAAGKGTRLYPVTQHIAKPLLPLAGRITLAYAFDRFKELGIHEIALVVGENEPQMRQALGQGSIYGVQLTYVRQAEPKGLAHALGFAKDFCGGDDFVLYLGDAIYSQGFQNQLKNFRESGCANLNLVKPVEDPSRFGVANIENGRIIKLVEKPKNPESNLAMAGLYFFTPKIWPVLVNLQPSSRGEYEITDAIQTLINQGETVLAGVYQGEWFDTGTLDSFLATSRFLTGGQKMQGEGSHLRGLCKENVVIGENASVCCEWIEDSVILPGAQVYVTGCIRHCLLGGKVSSQVPLDGGIFYGTS